MPKFKNSIATFWIIFKHIAPLEFSELDFGHLHDGTTVATVQIVGSLPVTGIVSN